MWQKGISTWCLVYRAEATRSERRCEDESQSAVSPMLVWNLPTKLRGCMPEDEMSYTYTSAALRMLNTKQCQRSAHLLQSQILVERLTAWFSSEEVHERLHLILTTPFLEHGVSVPPSFLVVHRVGFEDAVEHICAVDLRGEVAVVPGLSNVLVVITMLE